MNKILRAFVLPFALFFALSTATAPARAVLPLVAAGVALITEGGTAANGLAALTVGAVAGIIYLGTLENGSGNVAGSFSEIPLGTSRDRPLSTPPNWSPPATNDAQPAPPSTSAGYQEWRVDFSGSTNGLGYVPGSSSTAACQAFVTMWNGIYPAANTVIVFDSVTADMCNYHFVQSGSPSARWNTPHTVCSAGYTMNAGTCTLSNAALVMKPADGRCQILTSVSGYSVDPKDPECGTLAAQTGTTVSPNQITQSKPGTLTNGKVVINGDGSRTITYSSSNTTNNTTTITTINMMPATGGQTAQVTGSSVVTVAGTGNLAAPATPAAPTIDFPDDYNREITQGQIKTGIETLHGDLDSTGFAQPVVDPAQSGATLSAAENKKITDELAATVGAYDNFKLMDWSTWIPVLPASSCSPFTGNVLGRSVSIDICPKVALLNELIGWLLAVFAAWNVVMMAFRKD